MNDSEILTWSRGAVGHLVRQKNIILNLAATFSTQKAQHKASHLTFLY